MTIRDAISKVDSLYPNTYSYEQKIEYLSKLDGIIKKEIIDKHEGGENIVFSEYTNETPTDTQLLIPAPYTDIYVFWLQAWINYWNGEIDNYNNAVSMYQSVYDTYSNEYHSTHLPIKKTNLKFW